MEDCLGNQVDTGGAEASQAARPFSQLWVASTYWPTSRKPTFPPADRGRGQPLLVPPSPNSGRPECRHRFDLSR